MRKLLILFAAAFALLLAGALGFQAEATVGGGTQGLPAAAKNYSPVDQVSCRTAGPLCPLGYTRVCRFWKCWCARCK
ncbi:MAG: hypothetical protein ACRECX_12415 [Methyloceanibacter sp.]|uniref:hypothetical protein n=1 Tax=Methyloceanibacter sp. TaxID=1965321 RepID=UPI003D6D9BA6